MKKSRKSRKKVRIYNNDGKEISQIWIVGTSVLTAKQIISTGGKINLLSIGSSLFLFFASATFIAFGDSTSFNLSTTGENSFTLVFSFVDSTVTKADLEENIAGADAPVGLAAACEGGERKAAGSLKA